MQRNKKLISEFRLTVPADYDLKKLREDLQRRFSRRFRCRMDVCLDIQLCNQGELKFYEILVSLWDLCRRK